MANDLTCPAGTPPMQQRIRGYLREILGLSIAQVRGGVGVRLQASLSNTTPSTDTYKVPADQDFVVYSIQGYLRFPTLNSEPTAMLSYLNPDPSERWFVKAQNCLVQVVDSDRSSIGGVFDNGEIPLGAITPPSGIPMTWPLEAPMLFPSGHNVKATFTLQDSTTAIVGSATVYGLLMVGALIPKE